MLMSFVKGKRTVAIIQARLGSKRLPGKVLMPLCGDPLLVQIIRRVSRAKHLDQIVVATSSNAEDDAIENICMDLSIACYRGSEQDVLQRFLDVVRIYRADIIVRLTGDNPMVDGELIDYVVEGYCTMEPSVVYANNIDEDGFPYGLYVEIIDAETLRQSSDECAEDHREHVTSHIRQNPGAYSQAVIVAPGEFPTGSLTIDTPEDYERVNSVFERHFLENPNFTYRDLMMA